MIQVNGEEYDWREGMTVADLIKGLDDRFPYAVVRIGDKHISSSDFEKTLVPDNSKVYLIHMVAGG